MYNKLITFLSLVFQSVLQGLKWVILIRSSEIKIFAVSKVCDRMSSMIVFERKLYRKIKI